MQSYSGQQGVRHLAEIQLWEGSVVTFPMNQLATIQSVKALEPWDSIMKSIKELQQMLLDASARKIQDTAVERAEKLADECLVAGWSSSERVPSTSDIEPYGCCRAERLDSRIVSPT